MKQEKLFEDQGPLMDIGELKAVIEDEELSENIRLELRLKEETGASSSALILIIKELQAQHACIDQTLEQLTIQNQMLADFQVNMLRQL